jgi:hypothetical protein
MVDVYNGISRDEVLEKARIIERIVAERGDYFESTQLFTRIFAPTFLQRFPSVAVIHLLRDPTEVASSYMNRKSYPSHPDRPWRLPLNLRNSRFRFPPGLSPFQENLCDWLENELQYLALKPHFGRTVEFRCSDFGSVDRICALFDELGVPYRMADVIRHTASQDLDRNANRRKTRISRKFQRQADELVEILIRQRFPVSEFQDPSYEDFDFTRRLAGALEP